MKFNNFAYIYLAPGFDSKNNTMVSKNDQCSFISVGVDMFDKQQVIAAAQQVVAAGAQAIELCGGFGPAWIDKVSMAIDHVVPVGGVFYGPEARKPMLDLLT